nr:MAG TPA: Protein of unknown function (DUF1043) [Caudoviricetes sp.]DAQ63847.1 MAG TPA: Protein of unknown function (DUF1043) [Caudoviricetes sp.]
MSCVWADMPFLASVIVGIVLGMVISLYINHK